MIAASREQTAQRLREHGLRATASRIAIYRAVARADHPDAQRVVDRVRGETGAVSVQAVYDGLQALSGAGMLRRIQPAGSTVRYEARVDDNHHHLICRSCGATRDVDCAVGAAPCLEPAESAGFAVDEAEVTYWGICPECAVATARGGDETIETASERNR